MSQSGVYGAGGGGGGGTLSTLTGNVGGAVSPLAANINVVGAGGVTVTGNPGTHTLTITGAGGGGIVTLNGDAGSATGATVTLAGGNSLTSTAAAATVTFDVTGTTQHSLLLGNATGSINSLGVATNGQLPIGSTGADPVLASLTAGAGITITPGAGSITITNSALGGDITFDTDGTPAVSAGGVIHIEGDTVNISTNGATNVVTVSLANSPIVSGSVTAGTGFSATTGDVSIVAGNLNLPQTNAALTEGVITMGGAPIMQFLGSDGTYNNIFIGSLAGNNTLNTGSALYNIGIGAQPLHNITTGDSNAAFGFDALFQLTSGQFNLGVGYESGFGVTTGTHNSFFGLQSGLSCNGNYNLIMGANQAAVGYTGTESSNICIGSPGVTGDNNFIRIGNQGAGNAQQNACSIAGIFGSTVDVGSGIPVVVDNTGLLGTVVSSKRFKENIHDMGDRSDRLMDLRPVSFSYTKDASHSTQYGLIAEEVHEVLPELVSYDADKTPYSVRYNDLPAMLLNEIQKLSKRVAELEAQIATKAKAAADLRARLTKSTSGE